MKFRVELVWQESDDSAAHRRFFSASDGRVILQGRAISPADEKCSRCRRREMMISVDRNLIRAIKDML